jgi:hypothetical protein
LRRTIIWTLCIVFVAVVAILALRRDTARVERGDTEVNTEGHFLSDSLGVTLFLPPSEGWSFRRDAPRPGGSYITALDAKGRSTVRLFVARTEPTTTLEGVIEARRLQLARSFTADSLAQIIGSVMQEEYREVDGHPVYHWQALTRSLTMEDGKQSRVMFLWTASVWPEYVYECFAMLLLPMDLLPEEQREYDALMQDVAFIMQSFRIR